MFEQLKGIWEAIWGLLVEDGSLAVGIMVALVITWGVATTGGQTVRDSVGWLLLALLTALVLVNLVVAGRTARRSERGQ